MAKKLKQDTAPAKCDGRMLVAAICAAYLFLAVWCNLVSPLRYEINGRVGDSNADEEAHLNNVDRYSHGHVPVFRAGDSDYEAHQPPLYYAIAAPLARATRSMSSGVAAKIIRIPSILFGLALIWVTYLAIRTGFPESEAAAVGAAAFVAFLPMNITLAASITNDVLTNLIVALALWRLARFARAAANADFANRYAKEAVVLGIIMGVGVLTKTSTLLLFPTAVVVFALLAARGAVSARIATRACVIAVALGLAIGAPWLVRNTLLYGDPVAQHIFLTAFKNTATHAAMLAGTLAHGAKLSEGEYWQLVSMWTLQSFWLQRLAMNSAAQVESLALTVIMAIGAALYVARRLQTLPAYQQAQIGGYVTLIFLTMAAFARFNTVFFQAQGRYLYTALVPIGFFAASGISELFPQRFRPAGLACVAILMALMTVSMINNMAGLFSGMELNI